jgi:hypothetical protein
MTYTTDMNLISRGGYCMPFEERDGQVNLTLPYGDQIHPQTGEAFFHHGVDFRTQNYILSALADGKVVGVGSDSRHGLCVQIQYGNYRVKYAHLSSVSVVFGQEVAAQMMVGVSSDLLHMEVHYGEEEINPIDFITMLYSNMKIFAGDVAHSQPEIVTIDADITTDYDVHKEEIEKLMLRYYPAYMAEISNGSYQVGKQTAQSLKNVFTASALRNYFFETIPSFSNPLGISSKAAPIAGKVQNLLLTDFLNYIALRHGIFLSGLSEDEKKKLNTKLSLPVG